MKHLPRHACLLGAFLSITVLSAAVARTPGENFENKSFDDLKAALAKDPSASHVIHALRKKGDKRAIPILKEAFRQANEDKVKQDIAVALVRLGDEEGMGWQALEKFASEAIDSDMPYPVKTDSKGELVARAFSPEFLKWCETTGKSPNASTDWALHKVPATISALADSGDSRAIPLLLKALRSKNHHAALAAANGLARLHHAAAAKQIISEARKRPPSMAMGMGFALACLDDAEARVAVSEFVKDERAVAELRRKVQEKKCDQIVGQ